MRNHFGSHRLIPKFSYFLMMEPKSKRRHIRFEYSSSDDGLKSPKIVNVVSDADNAASSAQEESHSKPATPEVDLRKSCQETNSPSSPNPEKEHSSASFSFYPKPSVATPALGTLIANGQPDCFPRGSDLNFFFFILSGHSSRASRTSSCSVGSRYLFSVRFFLFSMPV